MVWKAINEWREKRTLRKMLTDPRSRAGSDQLGNWKKASAPIERPLSACFAAWALGNPKA